MPRVTNSIIDRIRTFRAAWRELAPDGTFAGMTLAEFEAASAGPLNLRAEIAVLETQWEGKKTETSIADATVNELLNLVVNSVRGTPGFGADCALYKALGYVRKSERKSGLTRKGDPTSTSANAA
jgi:hypothetical protein